MTYFTIDRTDNSFLVTTLADPVAAITATTLLPDWLTLVDNGNGSATLSGTPTVVSDDGGYHMTFESNNGIPDSGVQDFTLNVVDRGTIWTQSPVSQPFTPRNSHTSVVFNSKIWVIGGSSSSSNGYLNDVWSSPDGIVWTLAPGTIPPREGHASVVFNNNMWIIGGSLNNNYLNDVWSSADGTTWVQAPMTAPFTPPRWGLSAVVYDNRIWVMGGNNDSGELNDVWSSSDGATWTKATSVIPFAERAWHSGVVYNNLMWVMGGYNSTGELSDVWSSDDGSFWTEYPVGAKFTGRDSAAGVVYYNKMWMLAGTGNTGYLNDVWSSVDGADWLKTTAIDPYFYLPTRLGLSAVEFNDRMWIMGGFDGTSDLQDVWYSN